MSPCSVLLVDTLSSVNDFGVDLPSALEPLVDLTVFTIKGTRLQDSDCRRIVKAFPEYWGTRGKLEKLGDQIVATARLAVELFRHRRGIVHVQFFRSPFFELPLYMLMRPILKKIVYTAHNVLPHERRWWHGMAYRIWYSTVDRIHVLSNYTGEILVNEFHVPPKKIFFAPHGSYDRFIRDYPAQSTALTRCELGLSAEDTLILYYGLIRPYKGVERLLEAAVRLGSDKARILIAGACVEPLLSELRAKIKACGLTGKVIFKAEHVTNQDLANYIAAADVVVFPYHHIYQSGAALLAMSFGKAIIASDLRGFREYIRQSETGFLCDTADPSAFAAAMNAMIDDPAMASKLGASARRSCDDEFNWKQIGKRIVELYESDHDS